MCSRIARHRDLMGCQRSDAIPIIRTHGSDDPSIAGSARGWNDYVNRLGGNVSGIEAYDQKGPALNAISVTNKNALADAAKMDAERRAGRSRGRLHGIPVIVKDNYDTADMQTAPGSRALAGWVPPDNAFLVQKLHDAGAIIIAKSNMQEFAYGIINVGSLFGATRNPYALDRNPGGSSGGTGAAIAANFAAVGMGSDTCGSIRIPASHNSLVGIRGTQGLASCGASTGCPRTDRGG
jgi:amidase